MAARVFNHHPPLHYRVPSLCYTMSERRGSILTLPTAAFDHEVYSHTEASVVSDLRA